ncbi:MAG: hypothetical protein OXF54_12570 [Caldilineaceae bacterium]|nr:hypothetical protein [Caldilineaceae bacterium]
MSKEETIHYRELHRAVSKAAIARCHRLCAAARSVSFPRRALQLEAAKVVKFLNRITAISPLVSSPAIPHRPEIQVRRENCYINKFRGSRSFGSSHGPNRRKGHRRVHSDNCLVETSYGQRRVWSYGTRRGSRNGDRSVRSSGDRRVYSFGERHGFSYGVRYRLRRRHGQEKQQFVQQGNGDNGKWFEASQIEFLSPSVGTTWVARQFLYTFAQNLTFNNLPEVLKVKYQMAGNEEKNLLQAQKVWETIPAQIRAGGPESLWKFHQGKNWSHIIPKSKGGPSTADNAIWWSSAKNHFLGPEPMSLADIADARAVIRSDALRAAVTQTASGMVRGATVAAVVGGTLACLEYGLDHVEGKLSRRELVQKVLQTGVIAGGGAFVTTGTIVGIALLFPFLIPILTPVLFVLQAASLAFMGAKGVKLAKGWWPVLARQQLPVHSAFAEAVKGLPRTVKALPAMAERNIYRSGDSFIGRARELAVRKSARAFPWQANGRAKEQTV